MDPDPGGPKTCGSSGSGTLLSCKKKTRECGREDHKNLFFYLIASNSISLALGEIQAVVLNMRNILLAVDEVEHERVLLVLTSLPAVPVIVAAAASRPGPVRHIASP